MRTLDTYFPVAITIMVFSALFIGFSLADHHIVSDIIELDETLLIWTNGSDNKIMKQLMLNAGNFYFWIPFYCFLILITMAYDKVRFMRVLFFIGFYFLVQGGFIFLVNTLFQHLRPLYVSTLASSLQIEIGGKGDQYGCLPMSSNAVGIAFFTCLYFNNQYWPLKAIVVLWASITLYVNLYNGWSYPHEILIAILISLVIAYSMFKYYHYYLRKGKLL